MVTSARVAVEFHGSYYHADPSKYPATWVSKKRGLTAAEIWVRDARRARALAARGIALIVVWESEDRSAAADRVVSTITDSLNL